MGSGRFDSGVYNSSRMLRNSSGVEDFAYSRTAREVHQSLDPRRINNKPFGKLESRDSAEHPESNAILLCLDVTGSNIDRAKDAQAKLPNLMALLTRYLPDPQVAIAANDDTHAVGQNAFQISDFESDNRIDEHIRNLWLTNNGGGNDGESYDLALYAAANKTVLDCLEKRNRKGYFFMYADEPIHSTTGREDARAIFGDRIEAPIPIETTIARLKEQYHVFVLWPTGGYDHAREQYVRLFGEECVVTLQQPKLICEMIGSLIGMNEGRLADADNTTDDLVAAGTDRDEAARLSRLIWTGPRRIRPAASASA